MTRETILAHGLPMGFIEQHRQQARVAQARALGACLAALWRSLRDAAGRRHPGAPARA